MIQYETVTTESEQRRLKYGLSNVCLTSCLGGVSSRRSLNVCDMLTRRGVVGSRLQNAAYAEDFRRTIFRASMLPDCTESG